MLHLARATMCEISPMPLLRQREGTDAAARDPGQPEAAPRPVVLATLSVRVHPEAERMAIESALTPIPRTPA